MKKTNETVTTTQQQTTKATTDSNNSYLATQAEELTPRQYLDDRFGETTAMLAYIEEELAGETSQSYMIGWPWVPQDMTAGQSPLQIQMLEAMKSTRDLYELADDILSKQILEVRFTDNTIYWNNKGADGATLYCLKNLAVKSMFVGDNDSRGICLCNNQLTSAVAVFGRGILTNEIQGFLITSHGDDDEYVIYELEEFVIAASVDNDPSEYAAFEAWETLDEKRVFFTCYNKTREIFLVTTPKADGGPYSDLDDDAEQTNEESN